MSEVLKVGMIGFGNIGAGVMRTLHQNQSWIDKRLPRPVRVVKISDLDITTQRDCPYDPSILTTNAYELINDPDIDVIIELIGGLEPARTFVEKALESGKHVVTANKAMIASFGGELMKLAAEKNVGLFFEASVGGGIPIIRALQTGLCGNQIHSVQGIINGTSNYILTQMGEREIPFGQALQEAQAAGYAEPDPTFDIEGQDTAHKIAILATLAFGMDIRFKDVWFEGIRDISLIDIQRAHEMGYAIKLLGIAKMGPDELAADVRVHPTLLPLESQLAQVNGVFNAVQVDGDPIGPTLYYGQGAGAKATSSAIVSDLMALGSQSGKFNADYETRLTKDLKPAVLKPQDELTSSYYLRFTVVDRPGVIATVSTALAAQEISIESILQHRGENQADNSATITIVTHETLEGDLRKCLAEIDQLQMNLAPPFVLRVEES